LLQRYLQTWKDDEGNLGANSTVTTLQLPTGEEVRCTALMIINVEEVAQLLSANDGMSPVKDAVASDPLMPSMPSIFDVEMSGDVEPQDVCHNWVQQHHSGEMNLTALHSTTDLSTGAFSNHTTEVCILN
jgi:hypothetical protein